MAGLRRDIAHNEEGYGSDKYFPASSNYLLPEPFSVQRAPPSAPVATAEKRIPGLGCHRYS